MPEGLEAEIYRRAATAAIGRTIASVDVDDRQASAPDLRRVLPGTTVEATGRHGKVVLLGCGAVDLGLHFGMTGRLVVDGDAAIDRLAYASGRDDAQWDRLVIAFAEGGALRVNDPRRWARFDLDPDLSYLGPDVLEGARGERVELRRDVATALRGRRAVKSVLLDQHRLAGLGNMCADEVLFQAGVAPTVPAGDVADAAIDRLVDAVRVHLPAMLDRGGSHTGELDPEVRSSLPPCPHDGEPLVRTIVGGRTTVWCPLHQRKDAA